MWSASFFLFLRSFNLGRSIPSSHVYANVVAKVDYVKAHTVVHDSLGEEVEAQSFGRWHWTWIHFNVDGSVMTLLNSTAKAPGNSNYVACLWHLVEGARWRLPLRENECSRRRRRHLLSFIVEYFSLNKQDDSGHLSSKWTALWMWWWTWSWRQLWRCKGFGYFIGKRLMQPLMGRHPPFLRQHLICSTAKHHLHWHYPLLYLPAANYLGANLGAF